MRIVAIIQARMGSTRLPGKTMMEICGKPLLWHVIDRTKPSRFINDIMVATTDKEEDKVILDFSKNNNISCFAGSEEDVLDRYYQAAKASKADVIVRITADDPLKDPDVMDRVILEFKDEGPDYASNTIKPTFPLGMDIEVFTFSALERAWKESSTPYDREHVTPYIYNNPEKFKLLNVTNPKGDLSRLRWTVDTKQDLEFVREVYRHLYKDGKIFLMEDILKLLEELPELSREN